MIEGKTKSGFAYSIPEKRLRNVDLMEAMRAFEKGDKLAVVDVLTLMLGEEQKKALYDHVRDEDGIVPDEAVSAELGEMLLGSQEVKNS